MTIMSCLLATGEFGKLSKNYLKPLITFIVAKLVLSATFLPVSVNWWANTFPHGYYRTTNECFGKLLVTGAMYNVY